MTKGLRGRFDCKLDVKGRLSLPSSLRELLDSHSQLVLTNGMVQGFRCLDVYDINEWKQLETRIQSLPSLKIEVQAFQRFYLSSGQEVPIDNNHRVLIPSSMRKYAEISEEIVIVGMGNKLEIWSQSVWMQLFEKMSQNFGDIVTSVADMESPT